MARYGSGYYNSLNELIVGMQSGFERALELTCEQLCQELNDIMRWGIYQTYQPNVYDRTGELSEDLFTYEVNGLQAQFLYDNKVFDSIDADNPPHHGLEQMSVDEFMENLIYPIHDNFIVEIQFYIRKNYQKIYREKCRLLGLTVS